MIEWFEHEDRWYPLKSFSYRQHWYNSKQNSTEIKATITKPINYRSTQQEGQVDWFFGCMPVYWLHDIPICCFLEVNTEVQLGQYYAHITYHLTNDLRSKINLTVTIPRSLEELKQLNSELSVLKAENYNTLLLFFCTLYILYVYHFACTSLTAITENKRFVSQVSVCFLKWSLHCTILTASRVIMAKSLGWQYVWTWIGIPVVQFCMQYTTLISLLILFCSSQHLVLLVAIGFLIQCSEAQQNGFSQRRSLL